jgi:hypothetical protein
MTAPPAVDTGVAVGRDDGGTPLARVPPGVGVLADVDGDAAGVLPEWRLSMRKMPKPTSTTTTTTNTSR